MTNVRKLAGEKGPESTDPKRKKGPDSKAFREMMKTGKVRETDPEEKRGRKQRFEAEEELKAKRASSPLDRNSPTKTKSSPYKPKIAAKKPKRSATTSRKALPPNVKSPSHSDRETPKRRVERGTEKRAPERKPARRLTTRETKAPDQGITEEAQSSGEMKSPSEQASSIQIEKEKRESTSLPSTSLPLEAQKLSAKEKKREEGEIDIAPPATLPEGAWEASQIEKSKKGEDARGGATIERGGMPSPMLHDLPAEALIAQAPSPTTGEALPPSPVAQLPAQVLHLFERLAGVIIVMNESGITETTFFLDSSTHTQSPLAGTKIVISEYSTAPKEFNIEMQGDTKAVDLIKGNTDELVAAFQMGNYNFKVNRIDTAYLPPSGEKRREMRKVKRKKSGGS